MKEARGYLSKARAIVGRQQELKEHTFGVHIAWARLFSKTKKLREAKNHWRLTEKLITQFKIVPTPLALKYLESLERTLG